MMIGVKRFFYRVSCTLCAVLTLLSVTGCDDGSIPEKTYVPESTGYTIVIDGTFVGKKTWSGKYSVAIAGFNDDSEYALIQNVIPSEATDSTEVSDTLTNVSVNVNSVEIAIVSSLRKRIQTIYSYTIPEGQDIKDTIKINVGKLDVSMFGTINNYVFQGEQTNCSKCHRSSTGAGHLDLTKENAYKSLINQVSYKNPEYQRVLPNKSDSSFLYKVITEGDSTVGYHHPALFTDDKYEAFQTIIKNWIDNGAKE